MSNHPTDNDSGHSDAFYRQISEPALIGAYNTEKKRAKRAAARLRYICHQRSARLPFILGRLAALADDAPAPDSNPLRGWWWVCRAKFWRTIADLQNASASDDR